MKYNREDGEQSTSTDHISIPLPVALGLFIAFAGLCAGGFGTSIWWASSISTKMDVLVKQGSDQTASTMANATRITALELWQKQIDAVGSPKMAERMSATEKEIIDLRQELMLHKAVTKGQP